MSYEYFKLRGYFLVRGVFTIGVLLLIYFILIGMVHLKVGDKFEVSLYPEIGIPSKSNPSNSSTSNPISRNSIKWCELDYPKKPFVIQIDKSGNYFWQGDPYNASDIITTATNFACGSVFLAVNRNVEYGKVIDLMSLLKIAEISDIAFIEFTP